MSYVLLFINLFSEMFLFQEKNDLTSVLKSRRELYDDGLPSQPVVIVVKETGSITCIRVYISEEIYYEVSNVLRAVDILFKLTMALSLEYDTRVKNLMTFIQIYFFQIKTVYDKISPCTATLITKLKAKLSN